MGFIISGTLLAVLYIIVDFFSKRDSDGYIKREVLNKFNLKDFSNHFLIIAGGADQKLVNGLDIFHLKHLYEYTNKSFTKKHMALLAIANFQLVLNDDSKTERLLKKFREQDRDTGNEYGHVSNTQIISYGNSLLESFKKNMFHSIKNDMSWFYINEDKDLMNKLKVKISTAKGMRDTILSIKDLSAAALLEKASGVQNKEVKESLAVLEATRYEINKHSDDSVKRKSAINKLLSALYS